MSKWGRSTKRKGDNWATPEQIYAWLDMEFQFDHDPCPLNPSGLRESDGLGDWGKSNFVNPPYSEKALWIEKAILEKLKGNLTVMLLPVDTSTRWFHELVLPNAEIRWVYGRVAFKPGTSPPFASMICIFRRELLSSTEDIARFCPNCGDRAINLMPEGVVPIPQLQYHCEKCGTESGIDFLPREET